MTFVHRGVKLMTIPDATPLPLIEEALDQVDGVKSFFGNNFVGAYHQMQTKKEEYHETAHHNRFGFFERAVLCFGL